MQELAAGKLRKMLTEHDETVRYTMPLGDNRIDMAPLLGNPVRLEFSGEINCIHCDRLTKKSFNQGYCYPCFQRLAACDSCIVSPEKCHYDAGTCREPEWGEANCMIDHIVYLANTSGLKIGITRHSQVPTRWMDQGAVQALPIFRVQTRHQSGLVEIAFKNFVNDRTAWQTMLKGLVDELDMPAERERLYEQTAPAIDALQQQFGLQAISRIPEQAERRFQYPVVEYPTKVKSLNLDKDPVVEGTLMGIKGQYLMFDTGVINMRKYGGYHIAISAQ
ncbi:MAG: DUF2797 domain-containing protein [Halieaceae bacterium]|jgi:hypothetical protein|nr:DUF2797 domain-containing protein [Halieaceae bacterium]